MIFSTNLGGPMAVGSKEQGDEQIRYVAKMLFFFVCVCLFVYVCGGVTVVDAVDACFVSICRCVGFCSKYVESTEWNIAQTIVLATESSQEQIPPLHRSTWQTRESRDQLYTWIYTLR